MVTIIIKCQTLLSNLSFIFEDYNTWLYIDNYLEAAKVLAENYSCINGFKEISKAYSNIAIKLYKNKYYKESISLFDFSYKTLLKVKKQSIELANILDMLAICYYYIHEKEVNIKYKYFIYIDIIIVIIYLFIYLFVIPF